MHCFGSYTKFSSIPQISPMSISQYCNCICNSNCCIQSRCFHGLHPQYTCSTCKRAFNGNGSRTFLEVLRVVLHAVVVISEVLHLNTKSCCSCCCMTHLWSPPQTLHSIDCTYLQHSINYYIMDCLCNILFNLNTLWLPHYLFGHHPPINLNCVMPSHY